MRPLGPQHFECSQCGARILVTFSTEPPVVEVDATPAGPQRVVTILGREIHRCPTAAVSPSEPGVSDS